MLPMTAEQIDLMPDVLDGKAICKMYARPSPHLPFMVRRFRYLTLAMWRARISAVSPGTGTHVVLARWPSPARR
jgi:hypothetical protein